MPQIGELRDACAQSEARVLEKIINDYGYKKSYYIFKHTNWEGQFSSVLRSKYTLKSKKPRVPLLGTKLWLIDNSRGTITLEWDLPMDLMGTEQFLSDDVIPINYNSAVQQRPLIINA